MKKPLYLFFVAAALVCSCNGRPSRPNSTESAHPASFSFSQHSDETNPGGSFGNNTTIRVLISDTIVNGYNQPILSLKRQNTQSDTAWIKSLQTHLEKVDPDINVYFRYAEPIDGYEVYSLFNPSSATSESGKIIMCFKKEESEFIFNDDSFSDFYTSNITDCGANSHEWHNGDVYILDYISPTLNDIYKDKHPDRSPLGYYTPFQFFDIDFDGKKELLINSFDQGQQGNRYKVYRLADNQLHPLHSTLPFSIIDNATRVDTRKKCLEASVRDGVFTNSRIFFKCYPTATTHIRKYPEFHSDLTKKILTEYTGSQNRFAIDSICETVGDTIYQYRRRATQIIPTKCEVKADYTTH